MKTKDVQLGEPFQTLFRIRDINYNEVLEDIKQNGYDPNEPLSIWKEEDILIDGHTRLKAAAEAGIKDIPANYLTFENEEQAIEHAIRHNSKRRAVTAGDKFRCVELLDEKGEAYGTGNNQYQKKELSPKNLGDSKNAQRTAKLVGISDFQVNKMRTILTYCDQEDIEDVRNDELSIDAAWKEAKKVKEKMKAEVKTAGSFNAVNENIEWAKWSWNPVTGCKHGCEYCYARDIANRFYKEKFEPTFRKERLSAPENTSIPKARQDESGINNVFVCSMGDLFGEWVEENWIKKILHAIKKNPQWNYLFLTKNPKRYLEFQFPENCWLGATADTQARMNNAIKVFSKKEHPIKFISCEPLMEEIHIDNPKAIQWLIIGGRTKTSGMSAGQPEWEWVEQLLLQARQAKVSVYFKPNLTIRPKEYPKTNNE